MRQYWWPCVRCDVDDGEDGEECTLAEVELRSSVLVIVLLCILSIF